MIEEEVKILSGGMKDEEIKKNKNKFEETAKKRIKIGLILNEFGEQNNIKVEEHEIQAEVQKQLRMMPGQEKMVMEFYQKNPSALASLRGNVYEEKIISLIKTKAKSKKVNLTKEEADKILKEENDRHLKEHHNDHDHGSSKSKKETISKKPTNQKKAKSLSKNTKSTKKVSQK